MGIINILDSQTANMIAAGEVVERPASAVKELIENALDAGATEVFVEIKDGGRSYIRVTDNGKGISREDMPRAILRHATSKIKTGEDLDGVATLGFRGEALASISAVSRMEIISRQEGEKSGSLLTCGDGGVMIEDAGCPVGTSVIVKDLFYNMPARRKFLKKDSYEGAAACSAAENAALSSPHVRFTFVSDGEKKFFTPGDGSLQSAVYAVFGRSYAKGLEEVEYSLHEMSLRGYITKPENARGTRSMQMFFVNGRSVRSRTMSAALEEGFKSYTAGRKFPGAVLFLELDPKSTDVNVHPTKLEIKFSEEKKIFEIVYYGVKNTLEGKPKSTQPSPPVQEVSALNAYKAPVVPREVVFNNPKTPKVGYEIFKADIGESDLPPAKKSSPEVLVFHSPNPKEPVQEEILAKVHSLPTSPKIIGEAYNAYIFAEIGDKIWIIDKHAAHERILYEELKERKEVQAQTLMESQPVVLTPSQTVAVCDNAKTLKSYGFHIEPFGKDTVLLRAIPSALVNKGGEGELLEALAQGLVEGENLSFEEKCDRALFTVACKAALKAGQRSGYEHNRWITEKLAENENIRYCPHGRPIIKEIPKRELEKFFDR